MEIGNTPCIRLPDWETLLGFDGVWVKDESANPTGTFKDRRSKMVVERAKAEGADKLVLISMGNAANSLAKVSEGSGIEICTVVDKNLTPSIREKLRNVCSVHETDLHARVLTSKDLIAMVRTSESEKIVDVTNRFNAAYEEIVRELQHQLPVVPDIIFMPHGAGEAMTGVIQGVKEVGWENETAVIGIRDKGLERLNTKFFHNAYAGCMRVGELPVRLVLETSTDLTREDMQSVVPKNVQSEDAAALVFGYVVANAHNLPLRKKAKNIIMINSGCGEITQ